MAAMRGNQSHASRGFRGGSKIVISLDCPSNIMGSSAANGNHMLAGLTLHHNHYTREEETKTRGEETKVEARSKRGEQNREQSAQSSLLSGKPMWAWLLGE
ncbi:hypothetical protein NQZ68_023168 [Dissostichus eleginoides]|nr:hypothetical protein NQZ68_023168 [Dissostichus eleginoides]